MNFVATEWEPLSCILEQCAFRIYHVFLLERALTWEMTLSECELGLFPPVAYFPGLSAVFKLPLLVTVTLCSELATGYIMNCFFSTALWNLYMFFPAFEQLPVFLLWVRVSITFAAAVTITFFQVFAILRKNSDKVFSYPITELTKPRTVALSM